MLLGVIIGASAPQKQPRSSVTHPLLRLMHLWSLRMLTCFMESLHSCNCFPAECGSRQGAPGTQKGGGAVSGEVALVPPLLGSSQRLLNKDHYEVYYQVAQSGLYSSAVMCTVLRAVYSVNGTDIVFTSSRITTVVSELFCCSTASVCLYCLLVWVLPITCWVGPRYCSHILNFC